LKIGNLLLTMISVKEALHTILESISPLSLEKVNHLEALSRILGEDIISGRDIPPGDNSAMDGYALRAADTLFASRKNHVTLRVIEDIPAGRMPKKKVKAGEASRIMTGALIPAGADAVLRVEDTESAGKKVRIFASVKAGMDIRLAGEDVKKGEHVLSRGDVIRPAEIGMLASLSRSFIYTFQKPVAAILATGDELVDVDELVPPGKIVTSNSYALAAQVMECGGIPLQLGIAKDNREDLAAKFQAALRADMIISSGGVSVGDYDLVKDVMKELGSTMQFWKVAMRPGRPLAYGTIGGKPLFGLPGNPVSSMVSFEQFVRPALLKMMGHRNLFRKSVQAILMENISKRSGFLAFLRAQAVFEKGQYRVTTTGEQGSGILKSMVRANSLIVLPEKLTRAKKGDMVTVQLLDHTLDTTAAPDYL
jgi:molybdopterin molybdotransferase